MLAGRVYTVSFDGVTVTNAGGDNDLIELDAAAEKPITVLGWTIDVSSETGDAAEEIIRYKWIRGHTTAGTAGTALTPRPVNPSNTAAGFTADSNATTISSAGTAVDLYCGAFNVRAGERVFLPPEFRFGTSGAALLNCRMMSTVADDVTMSMTVWVEEAG